MSVTQAHISKILLWSCVDGPGNRMVLFLQGCNFACAGCHNPHTIGLCNHCGDCIPACPKAALSLVDGRVVFDPGTCDQCDACLDACKIHSNPMVQDHSPTQVLEMLRQNRHFLTGVTVSGGEATLQLPFVMELFAAIKADPTLAGLTCFVDSNGHLGPRGWQRLLPVTDGVMLDIKAFDQGLHRALTGHGNDKSLDSARLLQAAGKLYELRFLLIPDRSDSPVELDALVDFAASLGRNVRIKLNAFQRHGVRGAARNWPKMPRAGVEAAAARLRSEGFTNVVLPSVWL